MHISAEKKVSHVSLRIVKFSHDGSIASIILIFFCYIKCYNFFIVRIVRTRPYNISFKCKQGQLTYMYLEKKTPKKRKEKKDEYYCYPNVVMGLITNIWFINLYKSFITSISKSLLNLLENEENKITKQHWRLYLYIYSFRYWKLRSELQCWLDVKENLFLFRWVVTSLKTKHHVMVCWFK